MNSEWWYFTTSGQQYHSWPQKIWLTNTQCQIYIWKCELDGEQEVYERHVCMNMNCGALLLGFYDMWVWPCPVAIRWQVRTSREPHGESMKEHRHMWQDKFNNFFIVCSGIQVTIHKKNDSYYYYHTQNDIIKSGYSIVTSTINKTEPCNLILHIFQIFVFNNYDDVVIKYSQGKQYQCVKWHNVLPHHVSSELVMSITSYFSLTVMKAHNVFNYSL